MLSTFENNDRRLLRRLRLERSLRNFERYGSQRLVFTEEGECVVQDAEEGRDGDSVGRSVGSASASSPAADDGSSQPTGSLRAGETRMSSVKLSDDHDDDDISWLSCSSILCRSWQRTGQGDASKEQGGGGGRLMWTALLITAVLLGASIGAAILLSPEGGDRGGSISQGSDPDASTTTTMTEGGSGGSSAIHNDTADAAPPVGTTDRRRDLLFDLVVRSGLTSARDLTAPGTVPGRALAWLLGHSEAELPLEGRDPNEKKAEGTVALERYALAALWHASHPRDGRGEGAAERDGGTTEPAVSSGWADDARWMSTSASVCEWHGVVCGPPRAVISDIFSARNSDVPAIRTVTELRLDGNGLLGRIPAELTALADLRALVLSNNGLGGTVPESMGRLSRLEVLHLHGNALTGAVPDSVCALTENAFDNEDGGGGVGGTAMTARSAPSSWSSGGALRDVSADCGPEDEPQLQCRCCNRC